jgi:hypothetical protein
MNRPIQILLTVLAASTQHSSEHLSSTKYTGYIVDLDGKSIEDVRIQFKNAGEPLVLKGGEFEIELGDAFPYQITVTPPQYRVVNPVNGILGPQPSNVRITVVLGRSIDSTILDAMATYTAMELNALSKLGIKIDDLREYLRSDVRAAVLKEIHRTDEEFAKEVDRRRVRTSLVSEIGPPIDAYLRAVRDFRDQFEFCFALAANAKDKAALETLRRTIIAYNEAFGRIYDNQSAFVAKVEALGPGTSVDALRREFHSVLAKGLDDVHKDHILQLNDAFMLLQRVFSKDPPSRDQVKSAVDRVAQATKDLRELINTFDKAWQEFKMDLERW